MPSNQWGPYYFGNDGSKPNSPINSPDVATKPSAPNRAQLNTEAVVATHNAAVQGAQGLPQVNAMSQVQVIAGNPNAATQVRFWP